TPAAGAGAIAVTAAIAAIAATETAAVTAAINSVKAPTASEIRYEMVRERRCGLPRGALSEPATSSSHYENRA
ncbi:MAG TPA: hypothetical protein VK459_28615, partial [Polyangiaceae bacterium]|nr:hypothetical protein [Polyangiaceae bacterium]